MKYFTLIVILLICGLSGCSKIVETKNNTVSTFTPIPKRPPMKQIEPSIGMSLGDFRLTCTGKPRNINTYESSGRKVFEFTLDFNDKNSANNCWGIFTFENGTLAFIFRD